jgi:hypothetical protein
MSNHIFCRIFNNLFNNFSGIFKGTEQKVNKPVINRGNDQKIKQVGTCPQGGRGR